MRPRTLQLAAGLWALSLLLLAVACEESDPVAPDGSTIILEANPSNLPEGIGFDIPSEIIAVVFAPSGVPADGVEVFFTTEDGGLSLVPSPGSPTRAFQNVITDADGVAQVYLFTLVSTVVRGQSGGAVDEVTVTVGGQQVVGQVTLIATTPGIGDGVPRGTDVDFRATIRDTEGLPVVDFTVTVQVEPSTGGIPAPTTGRTDENGEFEFAVENIEESISVRVQAGEVRSNAVMIVVMEG